ncbi:MAG: hypothetical protein ABIH41_05535 [Nanoarchaeota archaeon]
MLSVAYIALISADQTLRATTDAAEAQWQSVYDLPPLAFDHARIIEDALKQLRYEIQTTNIAFQILPPKFTLSQMQRVYELVLDQTLDKRNFRKKLKELDILVETKEMTTGGAHRPARLYRFKSGTYQPVAEKVHVQF